MALAFNCGNLLPVAEAQRARYPDARIVLCADDDYRRDDNPGLTHATAAAWAVGGWLAAPDFGTDRPDGAKDLNDLAQHAGLGKVRACVETAQRVSAEGTAEVATPFGLRMTDLGNAHAFLTQHRQDVRFVPGRGWTVWDGTRFKPDELGNIELRAKQPVTAIWDELPAVEDHTQKIALARWAKASAAAPRIKAMVELACTPLPDRPVIAFAADALDRDPDLFNVLNGTVDLPSPCPRATASFGELTAVI